MYKKIINNKNEMKIFGEKLARILKSGDVLSLAGGMGAGKTTLTQFVGKELGVSEYITSPTFSIVQSYGDNPVLNRMICIELRSQGIGFYRYGSISLSQRDNDH